MFKLTIYFLDQIYNTFLSPDMAINTYGGFTSLLAEMFSKIIEKLAFL